MKAASLVALASILGGDLPRSVRLPPAPKRQPCPRCEKPAYEIKSRPGVYRCASNHVSESEVTNG